MPENDRDYFLNRAEAEIEAARRARHPDAARAHFLLAGYYLDLAYNPAAQPSSRATDASAGAPGLAQEHAFA